MRGLAQHLNHVRSVVNSVNIWMLNAKWYFYGVNSDRFNLNTVSSDIYGVVLMLVEEFTSQGLHPKRVSAIHGGEYVCPCPECGGEDRFHIWPNREAKNCTGVYWCRQCDCHGDAIQYCRDYLDLSFRDAIEYVGGNRACLRR